MPEKLKLRGELGGRHGIQNNDSGHNADSADDPHTRQVTGDVPVLSFRPMPRTARLFTIPRRLMTADELELWRENAFHEVAKSECIRKLLVYGGMAGLFILGMVTQYFLAHYL